MEIDYAPNLESENRLSNNVFYNPFINVGIEWGGRGLANLGNSYAAKQAKRASTIRSVAANIIGPVNDSSEYRMGMKKASDLTKKARANFGHARYVRGLSRVFGLVGMAQLAFEGLNALGGVSSVFATSRDQMNAQRYQNMYDQDTYLDSRAAYTQRQRALQVIHNSRLSLRPALGNEANYLHQ